MTPEQHAKVLEALELAHNAALNEALELRVRQGGYMNHRQKAADTVTETIAEALSIMRAEPVTYGSFYGCAYCQGGAGMGGDGCHIDANGLRVRCPNFIDLGDVSAPPIEPTEVKP